MENSRQNCGIFRSYRKSKVSISRDRSVSLNVSVTLSIEICPGRGDATETSRRAPGETAERRRHVLAPVARNSLSLPSERDGDDGAFLGDRLPTIVTHFSFPPRRSCLSIHDYRFLAGSARARVQPAGLVERRAELFTTTRGTTCVGHIRNRLRKDFRSSLGGCSEVMRDAGIVYRYSR